MSDNIKESSSAANLTRVLLRAAIVWVSVLVLCLLPKAVRADYDYCNWIPLTEVYCVPKTSCLVSGRMGRQAGYVQCCTEGPPGYTPVCDDTPLVQMEMGCCPPGTA